MAAYVQMEIDYSEDAMFGPDSDALNGVDFEASLSKFNATLEAALISQFPGAEIFIETGGGRYIVDGETSSEEAETAGWVLHQVWESFNWVVMIDN